MLRRSLIWCVLVAVFLTTAAIAAPQGRRAGQAGRGFGGPGGLDPVAFLKQALTDAGADSLSSAQEEQLAQLITSFRESHFASGPDEALLAARDAYQQAVLSGDLQGAKAAAATLSELQTVEAQTRLEDQAGLMIQVMGVLTEAQMSKLSAQFEAGRLFMLLQTLAGPPMGMRGPGPGAPPPM